jgi:hypothetical protein
MCFLAVDQVAMKSMRIVWSHGILAFRLAAAQVLVDPRHVMIDHHNNAPGRRQFLQSGADSGFMQKPPQA